MKVEIINPPNMVKPVGYSHMARVTSPAGTMLLLGGICGMDANGVITHPDDIVAQMDLALANIKATLEYAGATPDHIARLRIFTSHMEIYRENMPALGRVWKKHFGKRYPAMALLGLQELIDKGAMIEIECEAFLPEVMG